MSQEESAVLASGELLATRRPRRSTAGNRMEAALAEMAIDLTMDSVEDDQDFINDKDEEDIFGSDFESTDEEAAQVDTEITDRAVEEEERQARKQARSRVERAAAAAHARQRMTFNPEAEKNTPLPKQKGLKRHVSLGAAVNAETGEILSVNNSSPKKMRHSQRKHTILNTSATVTRMKQSEQKKAALPKKAKTEHKTYTQAELIALALDNEEGNIIEHRDYLKIEEEKRRRSQVVRAIVDGPLIRWVTRSEEIKSIVPPPPVPTFQRTPYSFSYIASGTTAYGQSTPYTFSAGVYPSSSSGTYIASAPSFNPSTPISSTAKPTAEPPSSDPTPLSATSRLPSLPVISQISHPTHQKLAETSTESAHQETAQSSSKFQVSQPSLTNYNPYLAQLQSPQTGNTPVWVPPQPPQPTERIDRVAKAYVVHELSQSGVAKPSWNETMTAMFGDHVKWDELKVYVGKGRPMSRPKQTCPITGRQAKYLDPRTGVPFYDLKAYSMLTKLLSHDYSWSPALACYITQNNVRTPPMS